MSQKLNLKDMKSTFPRSTVSDCCKLNSWELRIKSPNFRNFELHNLKSDV